MAKELFNLFGVVSIKGVSKVVNGVNKIEKEIVRTQRKVAKFGREVGQVGQKLTTAFTIPMIAMSAAVVKGVQDASDLNETIAKTGEIFKEGAADIQKWSEKSDKALGQSKVQAMEAAATFGIFGKSAGLTGEKLTKFSTNFAELASDLASFNNTSPDEAIVAIGAALRGENEPIRRFGVLLNDATMRQEALRLGLIKTTKEALSPQNKVLAAQALIYKQTKDAQGDFKRTSGGLANQQRILLAELKNLSAELGSIFLPMALKLVGIFRSKVLPVFQGLIKGFKELSPGMKKTIGQWALLLAAIGPVTMLVGKMIVMSKGLITTIILLKKGMIGLNIVMNANPIGLVITAIAALTAAGIYLYNNWDDLKVKFQQVWAAITYHAKQSASIVKEQFYKMVAASTEMVAKMTQGIPFVGKAIKDMSGNVRELVKQEKESRIERKKAYAQQKLKLAADKKEVKSIEKATAAIKKKAVVAKEKTIAEIEAARKLAKDKAAFEKQWESKFLDSSQSRIEILLREKQVALEEAEKLGAEKVNIKKYYDEQLLIAQEEHNLAMEEIELEELEKKREKEALEIEKQKEKFNLFATMYQGAIQVMSTLTNAFYSRAISKIEKKKKKDIEAIEASSMSEEEKAKKISEIEKKADKEATERKRKQAIADKAYALFQIGIKTALAIMNVLATAKTATGRILQVALVSAMAVAQTIAVAAEPIPFAEGGLVKSSQSGTIGRIGEGGQDELVFPLAKGIDLLADRLIGKLAGISETAAAASDVSGDNFEYNIHIGTLIGNDEGYRELERNIRKYRFQEDQRRGD